MHAILISMNVNMIKSTLLILLKTKKFKAYLKNYNSSHSLEFSKCMMGDGAAHSKKKLVLVWPDAWSDIIY